MKPEENAISIPDFLDKHCAFSPLTAEILSECHPFSCGDKDIDEFFAKEATAYVQEKMGKSYCFRLKDDLAIIVCAFIVSNDGLRASYLSNRSKRIIPYTKRHLFSFPSILIGRIGVNATYTGKGIGGQLLTFIKTMFDNPAYQSGCRYLLVNAYNKENVIRYYQKNGFQYVFTDEEEETTMRGVKKAEDEPLHTRLMAFDLIVLNK